MVKEPFYSNKAVTPWRYMPSKNTFFSFEVKCNLTKGNITIGFFVCLR